ncbi:biopolymer transporter ExbD [Desulfuromonas sp. CSMB_57]|jgi:biopolymer transport protein ExbD|uniref:ExbD/TolR family protein n=1 Tax=Desulfuromonas sp. CSMB_57 TaxID=2807629 RepID=UPI001CD65E54|nr:biopolymer transporter ExbD [Desulfuromonas sp. CSMB_57]
MDIPVRSQGTVLNLTPLIDIVFLLLIFFLLTTQFIEEDGIGVRLPTAASAVDRERDELAVVVTAEGDLFVEGQRLSMTELGPRLRDLMGRDTTIVLRGDREVHLQQVVSVMEQAKLAGAARIVVATEQEVPTP